ncbi:MAG: EamA family transporter [Thermovirga sp.]
MTSFAMLLLVTAAFLHAGWNLVAKRVSGGPAFTWLFSVFGVFFLAPFAFSAASDEICLISTPLLTLAAASALFETGYFLFLQKGYRAGDMSIVYPVARGTGPLLATVLAVLVLGEEPTVLNLAGTGLVVGGILWIAGGIPFIRDSKSRSAPLLGIATGACIAAYSTVDRVAVGLEKFPPTIFFWVMIVIQILLLTPLALIDREGIAFQWKFNRKSALIVAVLSVSAYLAVLYALSISPLSIIAPAREISVVIGTYLGTTVLGEGDRKRRMTGSIIILLGIAALASG